MMATSSFVQRVFVTAAAMAVFAGVAASGAFAAPAAPADAEPRVISVTGRASVPYKPDFVDLGFAVVTRDPSYSAAQNRNLAAVEAAMAVLSTSFNIKREDITTLSYNLGESPIYDEGKKTGSEYVSATRMSVRVRELGAYKAIILALLDAGVNGIDSISFGVSDYAPLREKAFTAAYADAERMARAIAAASKSSLGKVLVARMEGPAPEAAPMLAKASFRDMAAGNGEVISSGTLALEAEIYVEFELR
jgi:uncharacterized protein YggE